jgi:hypothetical protein
MAGLFLLIRKLLPFIVLAAAIWMMIRGGALVRTTWRDRSQRQRREAAGALARSAGTEKGEGQRLAIGVVFLVVGAMAIFLVLRRF